MHFKKGKAFCVRRKTNQFLYSRIQWLQLLFSTWWFVETVGTIRDFLQGRWSGFGFALMIHNSYTARIAIPLPYRALLSEEITWGKLHELGNCINEFFRQNPQFFSSWGLNTITNSFTNIRQLDPRWPVSAQKYLLLQRNSPDVENN